MHRTYEEDGLDMITITESTVCLECGYTVLIQDYEMGELVCTNCGTAFSMKLSNKNAMHSKLSDINVLEILAHEREHHVKKKSVQTLITHYLTLQDNNARLELKRYFKNKKRFTVSDAAKFIGLSSKYTIHLMKVMRDKGWIIKQGITLWGAWEWVP